MDNKSYEKKYDGFAKKLKIIGWILAPIGLICTIIAMVDFFMSTESWDSPRLFFLSFIGLPLFGVGLMCLLFGYRRKITDFVVTQGAPVAKDFTNYMANETGDSIAKVAGKVAAEVNRSAKGGVEGVDSNTCCKCGTENPIGAKFCSNCGNALTKKCPYCGAENDDGAKYCNVCGKQL